MVEDYHNAISWMSEHPGADRGRIGIWGASYSGGLVAYVGAIDRRAKAVVAQVPSIIGPEFRRSMNPEKWDSIGEFLLQDRIARYSSGKINHIKVVALEGEPCVLPEKENYEALMGMASAAPNWRNEITVSPWKNTRIRPGKPYPLDFPESSSSSYRGGGQSHSI